MANSGWLTKQPAFASHRQIALQLPDRALVHRKSIELTSVDDQCAEWLAKICAWIKSNRKSFGDKIEKDRSHEPIDLYLNGDHPMDILFSLAETMEKYFSVLSHQTKALSLAYRAMFLVHFLTANPLRINMFSIMIYRADNTGNLPRRKDGS